MQVPTDGAQCMQRARASYAQLASDPPSNKRNRNVTDFASALGSQKLVEALRRQCPAFLKKHIVAFDP